MAFKRVLIFLEDRQNKGTFEGPSLSGLPTEVQVQERHGAVSGWIQFEEARVLGLGAERAQTSPMTWGRQGRASCESSTEEGQDRRFQARLKAGCTNGGSVGRPM
jgi:hypothetical protein